jgi:hypothetical protein
LPFYQIVKCDAFDTVHDDDDDDDDGNNDDDHKADGTPEYTSLDMLNRFVHYTVDPLLHNIDEDLVNNFSYKFYRIKFFISELTAHCLVLC